MKEKYKDDKEMQTQETMRLFKEHKVNPLGGCLPMLIQFPVWIALYNVLLYSVDLYHSRFLVWRDLSAADPYAVLPILVGVLMFLQQRLTPMTGMDPTQAKMMRWMPLIFVFFMFGFPSGLGIYIVVNSVLSILQQWFVNRGVHAAPKPA
jgi:YidC/Oxa1 family membrane protein insertase